MNSELQEQILKGKGLKKTETNDRSGPKLEEGVTVGQNQHGQLMNEISQGGVSLNKTETNDRSGPHIEEGTKIGQNKHGQLMDEIKSLKKDD